MSSLVENLLSLARADGGAEAVVLTAICVDELFRQLEETWMKPMNQAMIDFRSTTEQDGLAVLGDAHAISRLLSILLENARNYTRSGGQVRLHAAALGERVVLSVSDTGVGIASEHLPRIFDRFYRVVQTTDSVRAGSGLGLALAKWIADRHSSELCVSSYPGRGSCFSMSLERTEPTSAGDQTPVASLAQTERERSFPQTDSDGLLAAQNLRLDAILKTETEVVH
jgi:signal transduction histidine kinase